MQKNFIVCNNLIVDSTVHNKNFHNDCHILKHSTKLCQNDNSSAQTSLGKCIDIKTTPINSINIKPPQTIKN